MAEEKKRDIQAELRQMTDPVAYRDNPQSGYDKYIEGWDASKLQNADVNLSQYGDDSSAANYNNQSLWGGENQKYTGENTLGSQVAYNPNATLEGLNPDYKYGQAAQMANSQNANYIASRNDEIASALYNAGKTSIQDVNDFLSTQTGWDYSNANERANTVASVRKRIGQIAQQQGPKDQPKPERETIKGEKSDGKIYGKATADSGEPIEGIDTLTDANNIYNSLIASRQANLDTLYNMSTDVIAASIANGINPYGEQAMVDYQRAYPQLYAEVQRKVKEIKGQDAINSITHGSADYVESDVETSKKLTESNKETAASTYAENSESVSSIINEINQELMSDQTAEEASKTMDRIEGEVAKLKNRLQNLRQEANTVFKGDAPDYLVRAYINNKTQDINNQLSILADRYSMASNRYNQQWENEWKQKEYDLKVRQIENQEDQLEWNKYYQQQQLSKSNVFTDKDGNTWQMVQGEDGKWYYEEVKEIKIYEGSGMKGAGLKNNNPGNIKDQSFGNVIGTGANGFAQFLTPEDGFDALVEKIKFNQTNKNSRYYGDTILEYFKKYAPESDGNNPVAYANSVAKELGVSVNTKIADLDPLEFAKVIARHESGYNYDTYGNYRGGKSNSNKSIDPSTVDVPDSIYREEVGENMDGTKIYRDIDPNSEEGKKLREDYINKYIEENGGLQSRGDELIGEDGVDHAYEIISDDGVTPVAYRQVLYNLVPTKLKDNVAELEKIYNTAKEMYLQGVPADEAALLWYGINPVTDDKTGMLSSIYKLARTAGVELNENFYGNLGTATRSGDPEAMVRLLENSVLPDSAFERENDYAFIIGQIMDLQTLLNSETGQEFLVDVSNWKGADKEVGFYRATLNDVLNNYVASKPEYQEIATRIDGIVSSMLNKMANGNFTDKQISLMEEYLPSRKDFLGSLMVKLDVAKDNLKKEVNFTRRRYGLPALDEFELSDMEERAKAYNSIGEAQVKKDEEEETYVPNLG